MSQENVEIVRAAYDAINREDWDALLQAAAPGFEMDFSRAVGPWRGVPSTQHLKGRGGIEVVVRGTFVWTSRNGVIERVTMYQERQDALEDLGLSEQAAHTDSS